MTPSTDHDVPAAQVVRLPKSYTGRVAVDIERFEGSIFSVKDCRPTLAYHRVVYANVGCLARTPDMFVQFMAQSLHLLLRS